MTSESFGVTPAQLRAVSRQLADASAQLRDVLSRWRDDLAAEGAAWGDCEMGDQFANGDGGYPAQCEWVEGSVDAKCGLLDDYSVLLKDTADYSEGYDQA